MSKWEKPDLVRHWIQKAHDEAMTNAFTSQPDNATQWAVLRAVGQFPRELISVHVPMFDLCREW